MDCLREFLESSTIHGLSYIATSRSKVGQVGWTFIVALGFGCAGWLIQSSFTNWSSSPIATTITPHPVSGFPFPKVAVCPPRDLNIALKHDLARLANMTLTRGLKESLQKAASDNFSGKQSEREFAKQRMNLINKENFVNMFEGYQSLSEESQLTLRMSNIRGSIESPGFGKNFTPQLYREMMQYMGKPVTYSFDVETIKQAIGNDGFLRLDVKMSKGFEEELLFRSYNEYEYIDKYILELE